MASEDVIELGSSDDEAEPATKKMKPVPNAMVHIPTKLHGVTIKPIKSNSTAVPKVLAGKNVTVTKITKANIVCNPYSNPPKTNGKVTKVAVGPSVPKSVYNPLNVVKKINSQVVVNKITPASSVLKKPIKIHSPRTLNSLPPSITVTKTSGNWKRAGAVNKPTPVPKKRKLHRIPKSSQGEVLTVELDDDDVSSASTASPQWYVRPEDQISAEEINNKEPEKPSFVEITIEDSPVKPPPNKRTCEVGAVFSVTIDDSPVKNVTEKDKGSSSGSDVENKNKSADKHSKKKLVYPKKTEPASRTIEIEIPPPCVENLVAENNAKKDYVVDTVIEIEESPLKIQTQSTSTSTPKKDHPKARLETAVPMIQLHEDDGLGEFHLVYRNFINVCLELENSDDMKKIVEKKIKTYYRQVPKNYTESDEFIDMVSSKILAMKAGPEKMYLYIKDIVDELNLQRKLAKSQVLANIDATSASDNFLYGEDSEYDAKRQRQIRKLEKTLKKLHRAIQKLEEQEVDFDDDEDSVYLLTERYKERMVRVHAKFCQLTNTKMPSEPRVQIDARPGQPQGPAKKLEKWVNKKVPIGTPLPFPDFHDVLRCVREANEEDKLGWNEADIMEEARDLFTRCGKKLQRRRQENEWRLAASRITVDLDPAEKSEDLKRKLEENKKTATKKETEVFNKYADRQKQLKLEAEEIGDKEAEESPIESEDDEPADESSLLSTEKRKERLKRLLQEKSKKICEAEPPEESNIEDKSKEVEIPKKSEENSNENIIATNESKDKLGSTEIEEKNEANKENQLSITEAKIDNKSGNKDKLNEDDKCKSQDLDNIETKPIDDEKIHSLSSDSNQLESDVDELHLLQKLHSENEMYSTSELSCSDTPIAISDTLGSSEDSKKPVSGVISIENSSYSESEVNKDAIDINDKVEPIISDKVDEDLTNPDTEMECSLSGVVKKIVKTNNDEYNESIEDILLASTDDEGDVEKKSVLNEEGTINLQDDALSIDDTLVETPGDIIKKNDFTSFQQEDTSSVESVTLVSVSEPLIETGKGKEQHHATENNSTKKQDDVVSVNSLNVEFDSNSKDDQLEEKISENHEEIKSVEKPDDVVSVNSLNVELDSNSKDDQLEEKISENHEENTSVEKPDDVVSVNSLNEGFDTSSKDNQLKEKTSEIHEDNKSVEKHDDVVSVNSLTEELDTNSKDDQLEEKMPETHEEKLSVEKPDDVTASSLNVILDTHSKDVELEGKMPEIPELADDNNKKLLENNALSFNFDTNNTDAPTSVSSTENEENITSSGINKSIIDSDTNKNKENDGSGVEL